MNGDEETAITLHRLSPSAELSTGEGCQDTIDGSEGEEFLYHLNLSKCSSDADPNKKFTNVQKPFANRRYTRYTQHLSNLPKSREKPGSSEENPEKDQNAVPKKTRSPTFKEKTAKLKRAAMYMQWTPSAKKVKVIKHTDDENGFQYHALSNDEPKQKEATPPQSPTKECESAEYLCRTCKFSTFDEEKYNDHMESPSHIMRHEIEIGTDHEVLRAEKERWKDLTVPAKCSACLAEFAEKKKFIKHARTHSKLMPFKCVRCDSTFINRDYLKSHLKRHLGVRNIKCDKCTMTFAKTRDLETHLMTKHGKKDTRLRNFRCTECGDAFLSKAAVNCHMRWHTGYRPEKCQFCGQSFHSKHDLVEHERIHSGEKPFECKMCDYTARTRQLLKRHMQKHTGEKPYSCIHCAFTCKNSTGLKRHERVHSGKKPFKCPYCGHRCANIENLRKHIRTVKKHKGLKIYPCSHCMSYSTDDGPEYLLHMKQYHFPYLDLKVATATKLSGIYVEERSHDGDEEMVGVSGSNIFEGTSGELLRDGALSQDALTLERVRQSMSTPTNLLPELGLTSTMEALHVNGLNCLNSTMDSRDGCDTNPIEKGDIFLSSMAPLDSRDPCKAEAFTSSGPFEEETCIMNHIPSSSEAGPPVTYQVAETAPTDVPPTDNVPNVERAQTSTSPNEFGQGYLSVLIKLDNVSAAAPSQAPVQDAVPLTLVVSGSPTYELKTGGIVGKIVEASDLQTTDNSSLAAGQQPNEGTRTYILASEGLILANVARQPVGNVFVPAAFKPIQPRPNT